MNLFGSIEQYYSYNSFLRLMEDLVMAGKTTGIYQSASLIYFTKLNLQRLLRWDKTFQLSNETTATISSAKPQIWWVITEAWCGDAAQTLPVINKMAEASSGNIKLRIIMRDEHTDIMNQYLTNGGRSIPKLIAIGDNGNELFNWGPRPAAPQKMMMDWKSNNNGLTLDDIEKQIHLWYAKDKGISTEKELTNLLRPQ